MALRAKCVGVMSSAVLMNNLLQNQTDSLDDLCLQLSGEPPPDVDCLERHNTSLCSVKEISSVITSSVSFVAKVDRGGARLVAVMGMRKTMNSP